MQKRIVVGLLLVLGVGLAQGDEIRVAVASNFVETMQRLADTYVKESGNKVVVIAGSTGKHYAQIKNGAPFDLFFAADALHPQRLEREGLAVAGSRFTYASGRIALWSKRPGYVDNQGAVLARGDYQRLAMANPKLAPYGVAAQQVLERRGLWQPLQAKLVQGENIAQAYQYIDSGNAELGFVAFAQLLRPNARVEGSYWLVPTDLYDPIVQQAVLLKEGAAARAFLRYVQSPPARAVIEAAGYSLPGARRAE